MMGSIAFGADEIFTEKGIVTEKLLLVKGKRFAGLIGTDEVAAADIPVQRFRGCRILPGLFDSHIHGALGKDVMDASQDSLDTIGRFLLSQGTTSWMPTTVTSSMESIGEVLKNLSSYVPVRDAARTYGCFVEGPYLTEEHRGAHPTAYLRELSVDELEKMREMGPMAAIAVAPEKKGAIGFIKHAVSMGVHISLAHTSASYEEGIAAMESGADAVVHTFCGMSPLHHRRPHLLGAALIRDDVYTELIADGVHVQKPAMEILLRCKPKEKVILVSDAISATGLPDGEYTLGMERISVRNGVSHTSQGSLAGSTTVLLDEVRRLILELGVEPLAAVHMASLNPSRRFGLDDGIGSIKEGKIADFLLVDASYALQGVWKDGARKL